MSNIVNLKTLRAEKQRVKERISRNQQEMESRFSGVSKLIRFIESPSVSAISGKLGSEPFNWVYDLTVNLITGRFNLVKALLWQLQATILREPLRRFYKRVAVIIKNFSSGEAPKQNIPHDDDDYEPHDPYNPTAEMEE